MKKTITGFERERLAGLLNKIREHYDLVNALWDRAERILEVSSIDDAGWLMEVTDGHYSLEEVLEKMDVRVEK